MATDFLQISRCEPNATQRNKLQKKNESLSSINNQMEVRNDQLEQMIKGNFDADLIKAAESKLNAIIVPIEVVYLKDNDAKLSEAYKLRSDQSTYNNKQVEIEVEKLRKAQVHADAAAAQLEKTKATIQAEQLARAEATNKLEQVINNLEEKRKSEAGGTNVPGPIINPYAEATIPVPALQVENFLNQIGDPALKALMEASLRTHQAMLAMQEEPNLAGLALRPQDLQLSHPVDRNAAHNIPVEALQNIGGALSPPMSPFAPSASSDEGTSRQGEPLQKHPRTNEETIEDDV